MGSTALARQLDLEDLRDVIRDYQERTREVLVRYEGVVARYEGDGVLAYFGYPEAHEDDAVRAIHAGLGIIEALLPTTQNGAAQAALARADRNRNGTCGRG